MKKKKKYWNFFSDTILDHTYHLQKEFFKSAQQFGHIILHTDIHTYKHLEFIKSWLMMTKGTVTTDIVYLPINEVSWLVSRNNNNNNLNRGIPRVPLLVMIIMIIVNLMIIMIIMIMIIIVMIMIAMIIIMISIIMVIMMIMIIVVIKKW